MKIKIISLGCAKNLVDSEYLAASLIRGGHELVEEIEEAEAALVNSCGFIQPAKEETLDILFQLGELKSQGKIARIYASGCLANRYLDELTEEMPEVDAFIPFSGYARINDIMAGQPVNLKQQSTRPALLATHKNKGRKRLDTLPYAYLKISEGCDNNCAYCAIPLIRGPLQSRSPKNIVREAGLLAGSGVKELLILGQDTTSFGRDAGDTRGLVSLLKELVELKLFPRIRLLYAHPAYLSDELIDLIAEDNVILPYLDLPLQHINDRVLKKMNRRIKKAEIIHLIDKLRQRITALVLRTTFIVGFPGESEAEFEELLSFVKTVRFERLGAFPFSREEDTPAFRFRPQFAEEVKLGRLDKLMTAQREISLAYQKSWLGKELEILIEKRDPDGNKVIGRGFIDAPEVDGLVEVANCQASPGDLLTVKITGATAYDLTGEVVD